MYVCMYVCMVLANPSYEGQAYDLFTAVSNHCCLCVCVRAYRCKLPPLPTDIYLNSADYIGEGMRDRHTTYSLLCLICLIIVACVCVLTFMPTG